jgi:hypothetical protein
VIPEAGFPMYEWSASVLVLVIFFPLTSM